MYEDEFSGDEGAAADNGAAAENSRGDNIYLSREDDEQEIEGEESK